MFSCYLQLYDFDFMLDLLIVCLFILMQFVDEDVVVVDYGYEVKFIN